MRITTAAQAAQRDANVIAAGIDSWELMHAAGKAAASFILKLVQPFEHRAISVFAGSGNNGGDAYVVAAELLNAGEMVHFGATGEPRTDDAKRALALYQEARSLHGEAPDLISSSEPYQFVFVDGLLGTGQTGELRGLVKEVSERVANGREDGLIVVALDIPTGVNATTGEIVEGAVKADYTLAFGTMKRGHVLQREQCGEVIVFDIGLGEHADVDDGAWLLADAQLLAPHVPAIAWNAHKGTRGRVGVAGGGPGMAGAVTLAASAALHSGAGLVHTFVHPDSVLALQIAQPQAIAHAWTERASDMHAIAIGPGLGRTPVSAQAFAELINTLPDCPLVLDADALWFIQSDRARLRALAANRTVVCTPHIGEFARLLGKPVADAFDERVQQAMEFANETGVTLLLKGTPTIVVEPSSTAPVIVARGNATLATGGSGDMLTGIIATLLAQGAGGLHAASIGAWVHGRAAEIAVQRAGGIRGVTLEHVLACMASAWNDVRNTAETNPVLAQLPNLAERR